MSSWAISLAVLSAACLAGGTHLQSLSVAERARGRLTPAVLVQMLADGRWLAGLALLGVGTVLNVVALSLAPVSVIQPIGVLGLALTTLLHCRHVGVRLNARTWRALGLCVGGAVMFVLLAVRVTDPVLRITERSAVTVNLLLSGLIVVVLGGLLLVRERGRDLFLLISAGALHGFVAVEMKVITAQVRLQDLPWWESIGLLNLLGMLTAALLGGWLVQSAYAVGPPELVMSGLTVVDPMVGVLIGLTVLGEAGPDFGPLSALGLVACALMSLVGVRVMSRHHPEVLARRATRPDPCPVESSPTSGGQSSS